MHTRELIGAELRLVRADKHMSEVDELIQTFAADSEQFMTAQVDTDSATYAVQLPQVAELPLVLPLAVSDAVHNFRAALDYMVYELACHNKHGEVEGTQFLIEDCESDPAKKSRGFAPKISWRLAELKPHQVDIVRSVQPYNGTQWTRELRDLSNPDKHRKLTVLTTSAGIYGVSRVPRSITGPRPGRTFDLDGLRDDQFYLDAFAAVAVVGAEPVHAMLNRVQLGAWEILERFRSEF